MAKMMRLFAALTAAIAFGPVQGAFDHRYQDWAAFLEAHVVWNKEGTASGVAYAKAAGNRERLDAALETMSKVGRDEFESWEQDQQLAFLLNVYNAWTVDLILDHYPDLKSIRDLGSLFETPWEKEIVPLFGEQVSLDHIEHQVIRPRYNQALIHAAVNCASCGCPALRTEPYSGKVLERQLKDSMQRFLKDRSRNRVLVERKQATVSRIFKWYGEDFDRHYGSLEAFFAEFADSLADTPSEKKLLERGRNYQTRFTDYDWKLNDLGNCGWSR